MSITSKTRKTLWARSGNRCAICKIELVTKKENNNLNLGEECHIISAKKNGPRYQSGYENIDHYDNLILCCCNHHKQVDDNFSEYTVEQLKDIKHKHEQWVKESIDNAQKQKLTTNANINKIVTVAERVKIEEERLINKKRRDQILNSPEGLILAEKELKILLDDLQQKAEVLKSTWKIRYKSNRANGINIIGYGYHLTFQFYTPLYPFLDDSYLSIQLFKGYFDDNGDATSSSELLKKERFEFHINDENLNGWVNKKVRGSFILSGLIVDDWLNKFVDFIVQHKAKYNV